MGSIQLKTQVPGPRSREVCAKESQHLAPGLQAFAQWSGIAMESGAGSTLTDVDGNTYVDLIGGIGVNALGHCHPEYVRAIQAQAERLTVGSFASEPRAELLRQVCELAPPGLDRLQLYSGGSEAVESAVRLARCYTRRTQIVSFWGAFHGKTAGAMALMGSDQRDGWGPLPAGTSQLPYANCYRCPLGLAYPRCGMACAELVRNALKASPQGPVAAVIVEPMQGTAGNVIPPPEWLKAVAEAARDAGALLIADEMICGFGRTGRPWGSDHSSVIPDIVTLGKGFGSGFPISGVLTRSEIANAEPWSRPSGSSSSYGGNPLAAAAALASVTVIKRERLWERAARVGSMILASLVRMKDRYEFIGDVRGQGLFLGLELVRDRSSREPLSPQVTKEIYASCLRRGLLAMAYSPHIRLQPALTIEEPTAAEALGVLEEVFSELQRRGTWRIPGVGHA